MSRAQRLLELIQMLRARRRPVSGEVLARGLGVSLRTLYRDIAALNAQGASIEGEPGLGYVLRPGFMLPPLMFTADEIEALALGARMVAARADQPLAAAARKAIAKIAAVTPPEQKERAQSTAPVAAPPRAAPAGAELTVIRQTINVERKLHIRYRDRKGTVTERVIWPFAIAFFDDARVVAAWCELREDIRHFRLDRVISATMDGARYPRRRQSLMKEWREIEGIIEYEEDC